MSCAKAAQGGGVQNVQSGHRDVSIADVSREFRSAGNRTLRDYRRYVQIVRRAPGSPIDKVSVFASLTRAYLFGFGRG